jgi:hypothetical protein
MRMPLQRRTVQLHAANDRIRLAQCSDFGSKTGLAYPLSEAQPSVKRSAWSVEAHEEGDVVPDKTFKAVD